MQKQTKVINYTKDGITKGYAILYPKTANERQIKTLKLLQTVLNKLAKEQIFLSLEETEIQQEPEREQSKIPF